MTRPRSRPKVSPPSECCPGAREKGLKGLKGRLVCYRRDITAVMNHDPAARSQLEVVLTYPGLHALWAHRAAHGLWNRKHKLGARLLSHLSRFATGVEIHPGAQIGRGVFIDHGMGVVIGETAIIGDGCVIYKGVVLGGVRTARCVRHPELGHRVVVGSNASILGHVHVGDDARIGSGSVVVRSVPERSTVVGVPGRIVPPKSDRRARFERTLDHASLPDPVSEMLRSLRHQNEHLHGRLERLERFLKLSDPPESEDPHLIDEDLSTTDLPPQHGG